MADNLNNKPVGRLECQLFCLLIF